VRFIGGAAVIFLALMALQDDPYPLSVQLRQIEKDLTSPEYRVVLELMIYTDLEAEWQRVATPDNYHRFALEHGGPAKVAADPKLAAAVDRRRKIADRFLKVMREEHEKRKLKIPFADEAVLLKALEDTDRAGTLKGEPELPIRAIVPAAGAENHWPGFRGPTGRGIVTEPKLPRRWSATENVRWTAPLPGRGNSSPVVWGDRLFITAEGAPKKEVPGPDRLLLCFDRRDGKPLWRHAADPPKALEGLYDKNTFASSTPVTDGERVIVFFGNSGLLCCDLDGKRIWSRDLGIFKTSHGPGSSPVLYKDLLILVQDQNQGASLFAAFDKRTGEPRWKQARKNAMCWASPVLLRVGDRDELIFNGSFEVIGYDPATGAELWKAAGPSREAVPMIVAGGGLLFSTSGRNGPTMAIRPGGSGDVSATHVVWRNERGGPHIPSPVVHDGRLYLLGDTGILTCLNAATGAVLYQQRLPGWYSMSPLLVGDLILVVNETGRATIFKSGPTFERVAENDLGEKVIATPAVVDGRIYFRTEKRLICVGE
jgi:outer membrane protein assembly factor BamB